MIISLILALVVVATVFFLTKPFMTGGFFENRERVVQRIQQETGLPKGVKSEIRKQYNISQVQFIQKMFGHFASAETIASLLKTAKLGMSVSMFAMLSVLLGLIAFLVLHHTPMSRYFKILIGLGCMILPLLVLKIIRSQYVARFHQFLPDTLGILSNAIKVGHNLESAIQVVSTSAPKPVCDEFSIIKAELKLGLPLKRALDNLYDRMGGRELKILITGISVHDELGGNLSEILDNLQLTIRERYELHREIKALSAQGVTSSIVLLILPFFLVSLWLKSDRALFMTFLSSAPGKLAVWFCVISQALALLWMRKVIQIKD